MYNRNPMLNQHCSTKSRPILIIPIIYQYWFDIVDQILFNNVEPTVALIVSDGHSFMGVLISLLAFIRLIYMKINTYLI